MVWQGGSAGCLCWLAGCHCWLAGCLCWLAGCRLLTQLRRVPLLACPAVLLGTQHAPFNSDPAGHDRDGGVNCRLNPAGARLRDKPPRPPGRNRGNRRTVPLFLVTTSPIAIRIEPVGFSCVSHGKVTCAPFIFPSNLYEKTLRRYETRSSEEVANGCQTHWLQKSRTLFRRLKLQTRPRDAVAADC